MNLLEILRHMQRGELNPDSISKASQAIGNKQPQLRNLSEHNALGHAYGTNLFGNSLMNIAEEFDEKPNDYDIMNNNVAQQFFDDLRKEDQMLDFYNQMLKAKESIYNRGYMRNPQYNWQFGKNIE